MTLRLLGENPDALAKNTGYATRNDVPDSAFSFGKPEPVGDIINSMKERVDGALGVVVIPQNGIDHIINVVNKQGNVYFINGQRGEIVTFPNNTRLEFGETIRNGVPARTKK